MSAAGIRVVGMARELAREMDVTLMAGTVAGDVGVRAVERARPTPADVRGYDAVVAHPLSVAAMRALARSSAQVVYDLFVPVAIERLYDVASGGTHAERLFGEHAEVAQRYALRTGNAFICASARQRDFWLDALGALGRIRAAHANDDPGLRDLVEVVPTGLPAESPSRRERSGFRFAGVSPADEVLLWAGGIWDWLDPLTVILATSIVAARRPRVKLVFLGARRPQVRQTAMHDRALELTRELGLLGQTVLFQEAWTPYDQRSSYLLAADVGVCAHLDTTEASLAFRTRLLDHIWAGLPTVTTQGEVLSHLIGREGLGEAVAVGDAEAYAAAIERILDAPPPRDRFDRVRQQFAWPKVVEPLRRLVDIPGRPVAAPFVLDELLLRGRISLSQGGPVAAVRRQAAKLIRR